MSRRQVLKATKQKLFNKKIYGFDIETKNNNKDFVLCSIYSDDYQKFYYSKEEFIDAIKNDFRFRNAVVFATNLSFDFFGTFFSQIESQHFYTLFRGSDLLLAKTFFYKGDFVSKGKIKSKSLKSLLFLDSLNYAQLSVAKMGKVIGISKLEAPRCLGQEIETDEDFEELKVYNMRDSEITFKFMKFYIKATEELGGTFKNTIASNSMALFKNKYLGDNKYYQPSEEILLEQFESYYGGRTEAFKRGYFEDKNYYDFNSLYPTVMLEELPDPNSLRITHKNTVNYINKYEGISKVDVFIFPQKYPVLPFRNKIGRVIFPTGNISGWYTHIELREAVKQGAVIKKVYKTHYFLKKCRPFKEFVTDLYSLRKEYQAENNPMEYVVKITLNSLYGKFGQKFKDKDNWIHKGAIKISDLKNSKSIEEKGDYIRIVVDSQPSAFCIPIWATYITAKARLKLHNTLLVTNPIYCDTDSVITEKELITGNELGQLKLEMKIYRGVVVRPKFYAVQDYNNKEYVKIKGLGKRLSYLEFLGLLTTKYIEYDKFTKFKESLRRDLIPNEIIETHKTFSLEDEKRLWENKFNVVELAESEPINLI